MFKQNEVMLNISNIERLVGYTYFLQSPNCFGSVAESALFLRDGRILGGKIS